MTMNTEYHIPEWMLKRAAKRLSKQIDITHLQALNKFAFELGFRDWQELKQNGNYCLSEENSQDWICETSEKIASFVETDLTETESH